MEWDWKNVYVLGELLLYLDLVQEFKMFFRFERSFQVISKPASSSSHQHKDFISSLQLTALEPSSLEGISGTRTPFPQVVAQSNLSYDDWGGTLPIIRTDQNTLSQILYIFCKEYLVSKSEEQEEKEEQHIPFSAIYKADLASRLRPGLGTGSIQPADPSLVFFSKEVFRLFQTLGVELYYFISNNTEQPPRVVGTTLTWTPLELTVSKKDMEATTPFIIKNVVSDHIRDSKEFISSFGFQYRDFPYHIISGQHLWSTFLGGVWQEANDDGALFIRHHYSIAVKKEDHELLVNQQLSKNEKVPLYLIKKPTFRRNNDFIKENLGVDPDSVREAALLSQLRHPHILPLLDSHHLIDDPSLQNKIPHLIFPFLPDTLLTWRLSKTFISMKFLVQVAKQLLDTVSYLHTTQDIVHRNLHPHSIFVQVQSSSTRHPVLLQPEVVSSGGLKRFLAETPRGSITEHEQFLWMQVRDVCFQTRQFPSSKETENFDIFLAGFHLAGLGTNSIRTWNQRFYPFIKTNENKTSVIQIIGPDEKVINLKDKLSKKESQIGDFYAIGCILYFLVTSQMIDDFQLGTNEHETRAFQALANSRLKPLPDLKQDLLTALNLYVDEDAQYFTPYIELVTTLLHFGTLFSEGDIPDTNVLETLASGPLFTQVLRPIPISRAVSTKSRTAVSEPPYIGSFLHDITSSLSMLQTKFQKETLPLRLQVNQIIQIPRISRRIGSTTKEETWDRWFSESQKIIFSLTHVRPGRENLWTCAILSLFSFLDKSSMETNPSLIKRYQEKHSGMDPLGIFILAIMLLVDKLLGYPASNQDIITGLFHVPTEQVGAVQKLVMKCEESILKQTQFHIWSPPHNKLFCQDDGRGGGGIFLGAERSNLTHLIASFVALLKQQQINILIFDINLFLPENVDANFVPLATAANEFQVSEFAKGFFEAVQKAYPTLSVYFVSRQDLLHDLREMEEFRRVRIEQKELPSSGVLAQPVTPLPSRTWSKYLYDRLLQLLPARLTRESQLEQEKETKKFTVINPTLRSARRSFLEKGEIPNLTLLEEAPVSIKVPLLVQLDVKSYHDFALIYTLAQSQQLWDEFHKTQVTLTPDEERKIEVQGHETTKTRESVIVQDCTRTGATLDEKKVCDYNSGLNRLLVPETFQRIGIEMKPLKASASKDSHLLAYRSSLLFQNQGLRRLFFHNYLLHFALILQHEKQQRQAPVRTSECLFVSGEFTSLHQANVHCMGTWFIGSEFSEGDLQNYVLTKTLEMSPRFTTTFQVREPCKIPVRALTT